MLLGALLVLLVLGGAGPASAHAALKSTDPEDGTVLKSAPRSITLTFTESVGLLDDSFRVLDPDNRRVDIGEAQHAKGRSDTASVTLPKKLAKGTYVVAWRVVSADSHPVGGAFTFSVGKASATVATVGTEPVENPATASLYNIARYLAYLAAALLIGTAAFVALCRPADRGPLRKPLVTGWWALLGATLALLTLRAPYETGTSPATAFDASAFTRALTGRPGLALLARLSLLLIAAVFAVRLRKRVARPRPLLAAGTALAVALALTWAASDHASAGIQVPLAMASSVLHLLAMAVWLGGLTALLILLHRTELAPAVVARFSRIAFASVTVLVVTGVYQSWRGLGSWSALTGTTYGRLLLVKLAAVVLLLTAAGLSRHWTARLVTADAETAVRERVPEPVGGPPVTAAEEPVAPAAGDTSRRSLRRSVLAEVAVGVVVLVLTTVLSSTLPGRAAAEAAQAPATAGGPAAASVTTIPFEVGRARGKVQITLDPGRVGDNTVQAVVFGPDGGIVTVPELRLSLSLPAQQIGPLDARVTDQGGYWGTNSVTVPIAGTWTMKVTVRTSEIDQVSVTKSVRIDS
ncbi:copper resistance CopC/CopD family protein [Streptomyces guryensis]|uniref:Protein YobA n=1 Tax=Streptomyces guryensis TaxID=2886947 RepID=A0A9Q3VX05_9ACTN|nr:copper resistance protein CopC [Streptomyces guryensis]MCD9880104.1 copper resistance protein CopC [Streptomyces guryensis]